MRPLTRLSRLGSIAAVMAAAFAFSGCMVGPDYVGPPQVASDSMASPNFHRAPLDQVSNVPPLSVWWTALGDETLNQLEAIAVQSSPTLASAEDKVRNARATVRERETALFPTGGLSANADRVHLPIPTLSPILGTGGSTGTAGAGGSSNVDSALSSAQSNSTTNVYSTILDASWQIDLFGGNRRKIEAAEAQAGYQLAQLEDDQVTLTADVAEAYVNLRDSQGRLELANGRVLAQQKILELTRLQRSGGTATDGDVERVIQQITQVQGDAVPLAAEVEIYMDQLAQLCGMEPGALEGLLEVPRNIPLPPKVTNVGDPASLIRRRPDVRGAERQLAANNALIGANVSQYFPQVSLIGAIGYSSTEANQLFRGSNKLYLGGPSISWNIFNFPSINAQVAEARAETDAARDTYRAKVLQALLDANNALSRFGHQRDVVVALEDAAASSDRVAALARMRRAGGTISEIDLLQANADRLQSFGQLMQGRGQLTNDWVSLQSSLGLGWDAPGLTSRPDAAVEAKQ